MYKDNTGDDYNNHLPNGNTEVLLFAANYGPLLGILGGGFYLHNISLPIYRNSKNPENSVRDMFTGFLVVALSYIVCGSLGALGFGSATQFPDS
jgi:vacuolar-type H+-ATPase subunit I/STV1